MKAVSQRVGYKAIKYAVLLVSILLVSCASNSHHDGASANSDPFEKVNRKIFAFNNTLDTYILKPAAIGYKAITPEPAEIGINNFFSNLLEVRNVGNDLLQAKWSQAGVDTSRFVLNTLFGLLGFVDVAAAAGLPRAEGEDFGQTLRSWGLAAGPYIVIPFLGPSTLTDTVAYPVDWLSSPLSYVEPGPEKNAVIILSNVEARAQILDAEKMISGDKYTFIREAYLQNRHFKAKDGQVEDDFAEDLDDF